MSTGTSLAFSAAEAGGVLVFVLVALFIIWTLMRALTRSISANVRVAADAARSSFIGVGSVVMVGVILLLVVAVLVAA